ncbi:MAG: DUF1003 domain-containing protein [Chloroflexi bacterium]|nr:MAG: DUF1003 domain-containing protein [Chloroflexota bacterium]
MYNDLLFERLAGLPEIDRDERIQALIEEVEALDNLLSPEAQDLSRDLRPRTVTDDVYDELEENATFGDRLADRLAEWAGSWRFIISFSFFMLAWMGINAAQGENAFDPFPFILLNLTLSTLAALQAPVILMSQNRQAKKDRAVAENDYHVNLKNELEIADLHRKIDVLMSTVEMQSRMVNALVNARKRELDATMRVIEKDTHETR